MFKTTFGVEDYLLRLPKDSRNVLEKFQKKPQIINNRLIQADDVTLIINVHYVTKTVLKNDEF